MSREAPVALWVVLCDRYGCGWIARADTQAAAEILGAGHQRHTGHTDAAVEFPDLWVLRVTRGQYDTRVAVPHREPSG